MAISVIFVLVIAGIVISYAESDESDSDLGVRRKISPLIFRLLTHPGRVWNRRLTGRTTAEVSSGETTGGLTHHHRLKGRTEDTSDSQPAEESGLGRLLDASWWRGQRSG